MLNGVPVEPAPGVTTITALLASRSIDPLHVVVEVNREIIGRDKFDEHKLGDGDVVEILRFVGGG